jgi:hypothetical protein
MPQMPHECLTNASSKITRKSGNTGLIERFGASAKGSRLIAAQMRLIAAQLEKYGLTDESILN